MTNFLHWYLKKPLRNYYLRFMNRSFLSVLSAFALMALITPNANAEISNFACGGSATYSVKMPAGILTDGKECIGDIVIDSTVKTIGSEAFYKSKITSVVIPSSVRIISSLAFAGTKISSLVIPDSVTGIGHGAFLGTQLKTVVIGKSVTLIGGTAFASNPYLASISIPDGLKILGEGALGNDASLTSIIYCGKLTGLPIIPTCPPDRKANLDSKETSMSFNGCPIKWILKLPTIQIEYSASKPRGKRITFVGDNREAVNFNNHLKNYYPELNTYIESQSLSVKATLSIEFSDRQLFLDKITDSNYLLSTWFNSIAYSNIRDAEYGVPMDPWVRLNLKIEVKGCPEFSLNSNAVQYKGNYPLESIEEYFSSEQGKIFYDFKQQELLRNALKKNSTDLLKPEVLRSLLFGGSNKYAWRTSDDSSLNSQTDFMITALAPMNCLKRGINQSALKDIILISTPCKIGVFLSDWQTGEHLVQIIDIKEPMTKYTVLTCIKGKLTQKITSAAVKPTCPIGWKRK